MNVLVDDAVGFSMFSFIDEFSGYNQIKMPSHEAQKTTVRTSMKNFHYIVLPFGLMNVEQLISKQ